MNNKLENFAGAMGCLPQVRLDESSFGFDYENEDENET